GVGRLRTRPLSGETTRRKPSIGYRRHRRGPPHFVDGTVPTYARPRPENNHDRLDRRPFRPQPATREGIPRRRPGSQCEDGRPSPLECALGHRPAGGDREYPEAARVDDWRVVEGHPVSLRRTECPGGDESLGVDPVDAGAPDFGERSTSHGRIGAPRVGTVGDVLVRPGAWSPRPDGLQQPAGARVRELEETRVPFPDRMDRGPRTESPRARSPLRGNGVCCPGPRTLRVRAAAPESSVNFAESLLPALLFRHGKRDRGAF